MHLEGFGLRILNETKYGAERADYDPPVHQRDTADTTEAIEAHMSKIRDLDVSFAGKGGSC